MDNMKHFRSATNPIAYVQQGEYWYVVGEKYFCAWNRETTHCDMYDYQDVHVARAHTNSSGFIDPSAPQTIDEITITLRSIKEVRLRRESDNDFDTFFSELTKKMGEATVN